MLTNEEIADRLRAYRVRSGFTGAEVGKRIGKSTQAISSWETCTRIPDLETVEKLCEVYGITIGELFDEGCGDVLSQSERWVLDMWRRASDDDRLLVRLALKKYDSTADADPGAAAV